MEMATEGQPTFWRSGRSPVRPGIDALDFPKVVEELADAVLALDQQGLITFVNRAGEQISGYLRWELVGRSFRELLPPEELRRGDILFRRLVRRRGTPALAAITIQDCTGTRIPLEVSASFGQSPSGEPCYVLVGRDLRGRVAAMREQQERLAQAQERAERLESSLLTIGRALAAPMDLDERLQLISELTAREMEADACIVLALEGNELFVRGMYGVPPAVRTWRRPLGHGLSGWVALHRRPAVVLDLRSDERISHADFLAELGFLAGAAVPVFYHDTLFGVITVLSRRPGRFDERELALLHGFAAYVALAIHNAQAFAQQADEVERERELARAKDAFLSIVNHELRTPLTAIRGYTELLERRLQALHADGSAAALPDPAALIRPVQVIKQEARHLQELIEGLVDLTAAASGELSLDLQEVDLAALLRQSIATQSARWPGRPLTLKIPPDLPTVRCDRRRIAQVLDVLVSNALKYSAPGQPVRISVRSLRRGSGTAARRISAAPSWVEITVLDKGVGISEENLQRVFEAFYQVDMTTTRKYGGLGLGLNLARAIMQAHGGEITVHSRPGRGSRFTIRLPVEPVLPPSAGGSTPRRDDGAEHSSSLR
jgi:PAS domain S-box-containing protein